MLKGAVFSNSNMKHNNLHDELLRYAKTTHRPIGWQISAEQMVFVRKIPFNTKQYIFHIRNTCS